MSSKTSVREKRGIKGHGELHVVVTAQQGWMVNPEVTGVVQTIVGTFEKAVENIPRAGFVSEQIFKDTDWNRALNRNTDLASFGFTVIEGQLFVDARMRKTFMRNPKPGVADDDYVLLFRAEWHGEEFCRETQIKHATKKVRARAA